MKEHKVELDYVGLNARERLSCYSEECDGATLVRQPCMGLEEWTAKANEFLAVHPSAKIENGGWRG